MNKKDIFIGDMLSGPLSNRMVFKPNFCVEISLITDPMENGPIGKVIQSYQTDIAYNCAESFKIR